MTILKFDRDNVAGLDNFLNVLFQIIPQIFFFMELLLDKGLGNIKFLHL